jgi:hypothetical protein
LTVVNEAGGSTRVYAQTGCFRLEIEQFNCAVEGKGEPMTPADEGLRILAMGDAFYDAIRTGRVARVVAHPWQSLRVNAAIIARSD